MSADIVTKSLLRELCQAEGSPVLSLYMPTHRTGREMRQDRIRWKNLLQQTEKRLIDHGLRRPDAEALLQSVTAELAEDSFWEHCQDGLAAFHWADQTRLLRLEEDFEEALHVGQRLYIRPLLPQLGLDRTFYVLALTQNTARLFRANASELTEIELPEIRKVEVDGNDETLQFHAQAPGRVSGATDEVMYHGQGGPSDRAKADIENFFNRVNQTVSKALPQEKPPLVLACVGFLSSMYEKANTYAGLLKGKIPGSPDGWRAEELRKESWALADPYFKRNEQEALATLLANRASQQVSADVKVIATAAQHGRIDTLFIQQRSDPRWGKVREDSSIEVEDDPSDNSVELLDFSARETILNGGSVYALDHVPEVDSPVAALMRY